MYKRRFGLKSLGNIAYIKEKKLEFKFEKRFIYQFVADALKCCKNYSHLAWSKFCKKYAIIVIDNLIDN